MAKNPQVILPGRYMVVARSLILLIKEDRVLLQKAPPTKKIWANYFNGLGGHVEQHEDILSSAKRELKEEAGVECSDLSLRGMVTIEVDAQQGILMFVFSGSKVIGELENSSEGQLEWQEISRLESLPIVEDVPFLVRMLNQDNRMFFGHYSYDETGKLIPVFTYQPD
jgi:8-oxo-dGTP diphosphatase